MTRTLNIINIYSCFKNKSVWWIDSKNKTTPVGLKSIFSYRHTSCCDYQLLGGCWRFQTTLASINVVLIRSDTPTYITPGTVISVDVEFKGCQNNKAPFSSRDKKKYLKCEMMFKLFKCLMAYLVLILIYSFSIATTTNRAIATCLAVARSKITRFVCDLYSTESWLPYT